MAKTPAQLAAKAETNENDKPTDQPTTGTDKDKKVEEGQDGGDKQPDAKAPAATLTAPTVAAKADPADIAAYCAEHGAPKMAADLIREGATMDQVKTKVGSATQIRQKAALAANMGFDAAGQAQIKELAETYIAAGKSAAQFAEAMVDKLAKEQSGEIRSGSSSVPKDTATPAPLDGAAIYEKRRQAVNAK